MIRPAPTNEPCIVGRKYLVPVIFFGVDQYHRLDSGKGVPILGPQHEDAEYVKFKAEHYHPDIRFIPPGVIARMWPRSDITREESAFGQVLSVEEYDGKPIPHTIKLLPRKCYRTQPTFPVVGFREPLREAYKDHRLKDCAVCPHRGFPLKPFEKDGFAVCPGHGLVWNLIEGRLATEAEESAARTPSAPITEGW